jgi:hypothetical protein
MYAEIGAGGKRKAGSKSGVGGKRGSKAATVAVAVEERPTQPTEPEIDQTIYAPPKAAGLPAQAVLVAADPEAGVAELAVPSAAVGELLAAYNAIRAFSWQLRISPFSFPDFAAAMASQQVGKTYSRHTQRAD